MTDHFKTEVKNLCVNIGGRITNMKDRHEMIPTIDLICRELKITRSEFLREAIRLYLKYLQGKIETEIPERLIL